LIAAYDQNGNKQTTQIAKTTPVGLLLVMKQQFQQGWEIVATINQ